jgi:hypothetical protein
MSRYYGKKPVTKPVVLEPTTLPVVEDEIFTILDPLLIEDPVLEAEEIFPEEDAENDS